MMLTLLAATLFYVNDPVVTMREFPAKGTEVVSQAVFSEQVQLQEETDGWQQIMTPDGYVGWIPSGSLAITEQPYQTTLVTSRLAAHIYGSADTDRGPIKTLPYGSKLHLVEQINQRWLKIALPDGHEYYIQTGDVLPQPILTKKGDLVEFSKKFLGLPYTWGGRSSFGFDCSGFVQMLYAQIGVHLQRDAKLQVLDPRFAEEVDVADLEPGDPIFWGRSKDMIRHVGIYIGGGQFIHSSVQENLPWVRISNVTDFEWNENAGAVYPYRTARRFSEIALPTR